MLAGEPGFDLGFGRAVLPGPVDRRVADSGGFGQGPGRGGQMRGRDGAQGGGGRGRGGGGGGGGGAMGDRWARPAARMLLAWSASLIAPTAMVAMPASCRMRSANGVWNMRP